MQIKNYNLNTNSTFESFIEGESNAFPHRLSKKLWDDDIYYNPLYIYGDSGLGKTHLLYAIGNMALQENKKVIYITTEHFTNIFISHIRNKTMHLFREEFRTCELLLMDDIQDLSGKEETQKEFFHTFEYLHMNRKKIVLTSNKPVKKLKGITDRLISRFEWGIMANIEPPHIELQKRILQSLCASHSINMPPKCEQYLLKEFGENFRIMESILIKINALSILKRCDIHSKLIYEVVNEYIIKEKEYLNLDQLTDLVAKYLNIKPIDVKSKKRYKDILHARHTVIYLAKELALYSSHYIAYYFGFKNVSSISHILKRTYSLMDNNEQYKTQIEELIKYVRERI